MMLASSGVVTVSSHDLRVPLPRRGFIHGAPDLAIAIVSQDKTIAQLTAKAREYLKAGTLLVWVVGPPSRTVRVHQPGRRVVTLSGDATLGGCVVLPKRDLVRGRQTIAGWGEDGCEPRSARGCPFSATYQANAPRLTLC